MKKQILFIILISILSVTCKKSEDSIASHRLNGLWIGTVSSTTEGPKAYSWSIKPDGTMTWEGIWVGTTYQFGTGTWVLNGTTLTCNLVSIYGYTGTVGTTQIFTAQFNPVNGTLSSGTWRNTNMNNTTGTFMLSKVN